MYKYSKFLYIADLLNKGHTEKAMKGVWNEVEKNWMEFARILTGPENLRPEVKGILDQALDYYHDKREYDKCKLINKCGEFLKWRISGTDDMNNERQEITIEEFERLLKDTIKSTGASLIKKETSEESEHIYEVRFFGQ